MMTSNCSSSFFCVFIHTLCCLNFGSAFAFPLSPFRFHFSVFRFHLQSTITPFERNSDSE